MTALYQVGYTLNTVLPVTRLDVDAAPMNLNLTQVTAFVVKNARKLNLLFYYFIEGSVLQEVTLSNPNPARFSNEGVSPEAEAKARKIVDKLRSALSF